MSGQNQRAPRSGRQRRAVKAPDGARTDGGDARGKGARRRRDRAWFCLPQPSWVPRTTRSRHLSQKRTAILHPRGRRSLRAHGRSTGTLTLSTSIMSTRTVCSSAVGLPLETLLLSLWEVRAVLPEERSVGVLRRGRCCVRERTQQRSRQGQYAP